MNRVYGEPVEVHTREDGHRPARFVWRGRRYAVRAVIEHWVVNREWWREPDPVPAHPELEFWRVEASSGQSGSRSQSQSQSSKGQSKGQGQPTGTYELRRDVGAGTWTLRRVSD
jgi:Family of unknown function (DUF6504)